MTAHSFFERKTLGGLWGLVVGDALGVPVEFCSRRDRDLDPVVDLRGYGTHNQQAGTWSDDTSLTLCTIETLLETGEDYDALGRSLVRWLNAEIWTPHGRVFDVGNTTVHAIREIARGVPPLEAGQDDEASNGNGSLMRILPVAIWFANRRVADGIEAAHRFSAVTHRHPRSQVGCALFCLIARRLLAGLTPAKAIDEALQEATAYYSSHPFANELSQYSRISPASGLKRIPAKAIQGSGYVVEALEANLWCLLRTGSFKEAVLRAVNLGDDTDTTGAITGALAGIHYGIDAIPPEWRNGLSRHDDLNALFEKFAARVTTSA